LLNGGLKADGKFNAFTADSSRRLNHHSNFPMIIAIVGRHDGPRNGPRTGPQRMAGEANMGRFELAAIDNATLGEANDSGDVFFQLGMMYSTGSTVATDYVSAHKWFNLAVMRGNQDAIRLRREVAEQMSVAEIAAAQRAARDWLRA